MKQRASLGSRPAQKIAARLRHRLHRKGHPLNLLQRWLGHAQLATTAIYADAVGEEERGICSKAMDVTHPYGHLLLLIFHRPASQ
jgi:site-specific recombinase XerD